MLFYRPITWLATGIVASIGFGLAWAAEPVEVPLWAVLLLTFMPLESIVEAIKTKLPAENTTQNNG